MSLQTIPQKILAAIRRGGFSELGRIAGDSIYTHFRRREGFGDRKSDVAMSNSTASAARHRWLIINGTWGPLLDRGKRDATIKELMHPISVEP